MLRYRTAHLPAPSVDVRAPCSSRHQTNISALGAPRVDPLGTPLSLDLCPSHVIRARSGESCLSNTASCCATTLRTCPHLPSTHTHPARPWHAERNKCQVPDVGGTQVSLIQLGTRAPGFGGQPNIRNGQFRGAGVCGTRALIPNLSLGGQ